MKKGDFVHYAPDRGPYENGRIKNAGTMYCFVVYKCDGNWDKYQEYTGERTAVDNLKPGWVDAEGNPIDTPKTENSGI